MNIWIIVLIGILIIYFIALYSIYFSVFNPFIFTVVLLAWILIMMIIKVFFD